MKNIITGFALFFALAPTSFASRTQGTKPLVDVKAEEDSDTETVLEIDEGVFSGYAGVYLGPSMIDGQWVHSSGGRGGWIANSTWIMGLDFNGLSSRYHPQVDGAESPVALNISRWGVMFEYMGSVRKRLHSVYTLVIGRGQGVFSLDADDEAAFPVLQGSSMFWFIAPEAQLEVNLTKYTKPFLGLKVLLPFDIKGNEKISGKHLTEITVSLGIKLGQFTY